MHKRMLPILLSCTLVSACGGSSPNGIAGPGSALPLSSANAQAATKASYESANRSTGFADVGGGAGFSAGDPGNVSKASGGAHPGFYVNILNKVPFGPEVVPCAIDGTMTLSGDLANPLTLTAGDTIKVVSDGCDDGVGEIVDGEINLTITSFSGDVLAGLYRVGMDVLMTALTVTTASDVVTSDGDTSVTLDTLQAPFVAAIVSGDRVTTSSNASTETLTNFGSDTTVDAGVDPTEFTMAADGTLDSSQLAGVVSYSTPVRFEGLGTDYPHTGTLLVQGEASAARLVAIDNVNVRIDIDADDDGTFEESIETTWEALTGS